MSSFGDAYSGCRVLLTGHTGFKGSWLALWLQTLGAHVTGLGLAPNSTPSHWSLLRLELNDQRGDIRDAACVATIVKAAKPDIVFHLAAQPLVRCSYDDPLETWSTNVMGTANVLEACRHQPGVRAIVAVTTDKCYENREWAWGYREIDRLGGHDPYSASKAGAELVVASYRSAFFNRAGAPLLASARAGNVIGGGDWSQDRLIPDLVRAISSQSTLEIRSPTATRPWQHVLESLSGYLCLGQKLLEGCKEFGGAWNFGPDAEGNRSVVDVLTRLQASWPALSWRVTEQVQPHEAGLLHLDSTKARLQLDWKPVWSLDEGLAATAQWYKTRDETQAIISREQLEAYMDSARQADLEWAKA
ncbi:CDP-glucose 4,6-dehydratase [Alcaligenaceae bacterium]|nr:CDP-glucose 4,6-dehydratase [Alcaligenaceae bacterium]